jgi:hypothetical protein
MSSYAPSESGIESTVSLIDDLRSQAQQIAWLKERMKTIVVESIRTQDKLLQIEDHTRSLNSRIVSGFDDALGELKHDLSDLKAEMHRLSSPSPQSLADSIDQLKAEIDTVKFAGNFQNFCWDGVSVDSVTAALHRVEQSVASLARARQHDVLAINGVLEKLDKRMEVVVTNCCCQPEFPGGPGAHSRAYQRELETIKKTLDQLQGERIPDIEEAVATRVRDLNDQVEILRTDVRLFRDERNTYIDRSALRDMKLNQMLSMAEQTKQLTERSEGTWLEAQTRVTFLERELQAARAEIQKLADRVSVLSAIDERVEISRAEARSATERVARQHTQELDFVRDQTGKISVLRDEVFRLAEDVRAIRKDEFIKTPPKLPPAPIATPLAPNSETLVHEALDTWTWTISDIDRRILRPDEFPRVLLSPLFPLDTSPYGPRGRLKLFPRGSDQCRREGFCSLYLRCSGGLRHLRFSLLVNGEVLETFECEFEQEKDKGRNEFCRIEDYVKPDGSIVFGVKIISSLN